MSLKDRTNSLWEDFHLPQFHSLNRNHKTEVCVIGGGMSGVSVAYQLAKRGHSVTLVEAFRIGSGQTGRTTAHLSTQLETPFFQLLKKHDKQIVREFLDAHRTAVNEIEHLVEAEGIRCDFKRLSGYYFLGKNESKEFLTKEQNAASLCGIDLAYVSETPFLSEKIPSLVFKNQGQFHPLRYLWGLANSLKDMGVPVFEGTHIEKIFNRNSTTTILKTDSGYSIEAQFVVVATHTPVNNRFSIHNKQLAYRTYAMSFDVEEDIQDQALLWDTEEPYHYVRFSGKKIIVGGEDHRVGHAPSYYPFLNLEKWARENFHFIKDVREKWSGQVFEPIDQVAFIGKSPGVEQNIFIVAGESGIGMTTSTIASMLIPDLIENKFHPWAYLFDPERKLSSGIVDIVKENVELAYQYKDWLTGPDVKSEEEIPKDKGCLLREGLTKVCIYHDQFDHFEKKTAVCSHLGGIVHWNDIEKTWDCPVHGSRFSTHGKVLEGPALSNLAES